MKKGTPINNNVAIKQRYEKALLRLVDRMRNTTENEIKKLFCSKSAKNYFKFANDAKQEKTVTTKTKLLLAALLLKFQLMFKRKSKTLAQAMLEDAQKYASGAVRSSLKALTGESLDTSMLSHVGRIKLKALLQANVTLIKSIPEQYFTQITGELMRAIVTGSTVSLTDAIAKHGKISERRARMIALDQTNKAIQSISRQKMVDKGISRFQWVYTYRSKEPRPSHVAMNGNVYRMDAPPVINADSSGPPQYGFPGDLINCKCIARPVAEWEK